MPGGIHPPISVILSWPMPHYNDPVTRGPAALVLSVFLGIIAVLMVGTRLVARAFVQHNFGIDDWVILVAMLPTIGLAVGICLATQVYGFDRHLWDVRSAGWVPARQIQFANEFLYVWASGLIKISILLFYRRMTAGTFSKTFIYIIWGCIAFVTGYIISFTFSLIFACSPIHAYWQQVNPLWAQLHNYSCLNEPVSILSASAVALVQDMIAATLPLALFWSLEIPKRQKFALIAVFLIGYFLVAVNAVRMYYVYRTFYSTYDTTWEAYDIWLWTTVEILVAPMCASAPALKVFFRSLLQDRTWPSRGRSRAGSRGWIRTGTNPDDGRDSFQDPKSTKAGGSRASSPTVFAESKRPLDSPTLGTEPEPGVEMNYFKTPEGTTFPATQPTQSSVEAFMPANLNAHDVHGQRGNFTKVEKTLGL